MGEPDDLSVSETGSYKSMGEGPRTDTEAFAASSHGVPDTELDSPTLDRPADSFSTGEWPTIPLNENRRSNVTEPVVTSGRLLLMAGAGLIAIMVVGALAGVVVGLALGDAEPQEDLAPPDPPASDDNEPIPVREGIR